MLYNKNWDKPQVKADPFSLESLVAWLEKQPKRETYCYIDHGRCLLGQYFTDCGFESPHIFSDGYFDHGPADDRGRKNYPDAFNEIAIGMPRNFSAALVRARKHSR